MLEKYRGSLDWLEEGELRSWVEAGNSPYTNPEGVIHEDGIQFDFIGFDGSYAESEFSPRSKKEAIEILRHLQQLLGNEARDYMGFLRSENLMERYMEYKYCEELPFT